MKIAILSTPANIEIAQQFIDQSSSRRDLTHYFKRGKLFQRWGNGKEEATGNTLSRLTVLKDMRAENVDHLIVVELPYRRSKLLPYYALLALLSKAARRSVLLQDGYCVPITGKMFVGLACELIILLLKFLGLFPLLLVNVVVLVSVAVGVDLFQSIRSRSIAGRITGKTRPV